MFSCCFWSSSTASPDQDSVAPEAFIAEKAVIRTEQRCMEEDSDKKASEQIERTEDQPLHMCW